MRMDRMVRLLISCPHPPYQRDFHPGFNQIIYSKGKDIYFVDFLPSPVLSLVATGKFCAAAMQDGNINVYTHWGRRCVF